MGGVFCAVLALGGVRAPAVPALAQTAELQIVADRGAYTVGDVAAVRVANLAECAGRAVRLRFRGVTNGAVFSADDVTLDPGGNGRTELALASDNNGSPVLLLLAAVLAGALRVRGSGR